MRVQQEWPNRIKRLRQFHGVTQKQFARRIRMSYFRLGEIERCHVRPTDREQSKLAKALDVTVPALIQA
jgi:transcriptional regulator with XRE-family HTH domain